MPPPTKRRLPSDIHGRALHSANAELAELRQRLDTVDQAILERSRCRQDPRDLAVRRQVIADEIEMAFQRRRMALASLEIQERHG